MTKRICALALSLVLVFLMLPGPGEAADKTPLESTAELLTMAHYAMLSKVTIKSGRYKTEEEFFNEMAFLELTGHSYGSPAYRSHDNVWDAVFQPDSSGKKVATVQLVASATTLGTDTRNATVALYHMYGLCSPFWTMDSSLNDFAQDFIDIYAEALVATGKKQTRTISVEGVKIYCYRNGDTLGIVLDYPKPVDEDMIWGNTVAYAMLYSLMNQ